MNCQGMHILLVEDSEINQLITKTLLQRLGFVVTIANHGKEALTKIASKIFKAVIMDIQMPEMDGFESSSRIRAMNDKYFKKIPIFAFTDFGKTEIKDRALRSGMNDFINKPILPNELQEKITQYITNADRRDIFIDFDLYTDGDLDFKKELTSLIIHNIHELQEAILVDDKEFFLSVTHKVKTTLVMLDDAEFSQLMDRFEGLITGHGSHRELNERRIQLIGLCEDIIESLTFHSRN
jgi:CheY-like chemotaxis protein